MNPRLWSPILFATAFAACNSSRHDPVPVATSGDPGSMVRLSGGNLTVGFAGGRLKASASLGAFSISKTPVTVEQFQSCVAGGVCRWSDASCANPQGAGSDVAQCVGFESASAYCAWVGGKLPTLAEWMRAARGPVPQRFPWGDAAATCEQHPRASAPPQQRLGFEEARVNAEYGYCGVEADARLRTGEHFAGASAAGLEDILLSEGELVRGSAGGPISVCLGESSGCVVFGLMPGAIDAAEPVATAKTTEGSDALPVSHPYGFRCVKSEEAL